MHENMQKFQCAKLENEILSLLCDLYSVRTKRGVITCLIKRKKLRAHTHKHTNLKENIGNYFILQCWDQTHGLTHDRQVH